MSSDSTNPLPVVSASAVLVERLARHVLLDVRERPVGGNFRRGHDIDAPSGFADFAPVSSKISTASHGRVPAQADVSSLRADLADRLGDLCNGLNVRDAVSGLAFVHWSRDREDDWFTCDVALAVLPGELVGVGDAIVLDSWPVACAQIGRDHLMSRNSRMPIEKNPWAVRVRSPSGGASDGVFYVFVGRHGIETVSGAELLLDLSDRRPHRSEPASSL